jgi:hypothetical protein
MCIVPIPRMMAACNANTAKEGIVCLPPCRAADPPLTLRIHAKAGALAPMDRTRDVQAAAAADGPDGGVVGAGLSRPRSAGPSTPAGCAPGNERAMPLSSIAWDALSAAPWDLMVVGALGGPEHIAAAVLPLLPLLRLLHLVRSVVGSRAGGNDNWHWFRCYHC